MHKKILLLSIMPFCLAYGVKPGSDKPHKDGNWCDVCRYAAVGTIQELAKHGKLPDLEIVSSQAGREVGATAAKELAGIVAAPTTKQLTDDLGKNAGATAATALGAATVTAAKIGACVAAAAGTVYVAEKVADRCFPVEQEQAKRAEAAIEAFKSTVVLEDMRAERRADHAFTQCLTYFPKQIRNSLECPGNCMDDYRKLVLLGQQAVADEKLVRLKKADDCPVPAMSAHEAEQEVRKSFEENLNGPMRAIETVKSTYYSWLWSSSGVTIELPEKTIVLLEGRSSLDPARFAKLYAEIITAKYPHIKVCLADLVVDKKGYPARIAVHLTIDGNKVYPKTGPAIV